MKEEKVKRKMIAWMVSALGALLPSILFAQGSPDIMWQTNGHPNNIVSVCFSPDNNLLASGANDTAGGPAKVWRVSDTTLVRGFAIPNDNTVIVAFSTDGLNLFGGGGDGLYRLWQVSDGSVIWGGGGQNNGVGAAAFSPDGSMIGLARTGLALLWASDGSGIMSLYGHTASVGSVAFSPDSTLLVSASDDWTAKIWRVADGTVIRDLIGHSLYVRAVDFSPDGQLVATGSADDTIRLWTVTNGAALKVLNSGETFSLQFSPDGRLLAAVCCGMIKFWRVADGSLLKVYDQEMGGGATCVRISPNGKYFAYGRFDGVVVLARMPVLIMETSLSGGQVILLWQGGTGLYQVQQCTNLTTGSWESFGSPTTATASTNTVSASSVFYRVQSLPNAP